ncbi:MAG: alanine--glyoxylate aminotransferase family protein, partial [Candidatus Omnitrophica bacterium]|nr:alanine--glyoxylate aminotransferase family protein [Candidatus Omnitrophota bacterium]
MKRTLLLTPGPTQVPPRLCEVLGRPIIHHRTPQFQSFLKEVGEGLKEVLKTKNEVYLLAGSGTAAMEASVVSFLSPGDKVIIAEAGKFGERWGEICKAYGIQATVLKAVWGTNVKPADIKKVLDSDKSIKAVFATHSETSTGTNADIEGIGKVVKDTPAILVVDAVSGLAVQDLQTDNWHVDVVCSASHKGLMLSPGVAFVSVSPKADALLASSTTPKYYFDLRKYKKAWTSIDTPFTPAIGVVIALAESLKMIKEDGLDNMLAGYARLAKGTRAAALALGLTLFADESAISNVLTAIRVPDNIDGEKVLKMMRDTHGISVAPGQDAVKGKIIR